MQSMLEDQLLKITTTLKGRLDLTRKILKFMVEKEGAVQGGAARAILGV